MEAIHFGYLMLSSDGIPAGVLFNWMLDTSDGRVYSLDTADYPRFPLFTGSGHAANAGTTAFSKPEFWFVFDELTQLSTWRVYRNCTVRLTIWRSWPD